MLASCYEIISFSWRLVKYPYEFRTLRDGDMEVAISVIKYKAWIAIMKQGGLYFSEN
jgi:hypothetical protein